MNKIDKEEYFSFIDSNNEITNCEKKVLKYLTTQLGKIYVDRKSDKQFYTYVNNANKSQNPTQLSKMIILLQKFIGYKQANKLTQELKYNFATDKTILKRMDELRSKDKKLSRPNKNDVYNLCSSWKYIIENISLYYLNNLTESNSDVSKIKYLDIGCGNGNKTTMFSKAIGLNLDNVYGTDIKQWGPYDAELHGSHDFNFKYLKEDGTLDFPDNHFDLISCVLMLHHVESIDLLLGEIRRVLKPNGKILIIEHDCHDDYDKMLLELLHGCFGYLEDKNDEISYSSYHNWMEWNYIFNRNKLHFNHFNYIFVNIDHNTRFDNIYYAFYTKK